MRSPRAWTKLTGRRVRLLRTITAKGGWAFRKGSICTIDRVWKALFSLRRVSRPKPIANEDGSVTTPWVISGVSYSSFEVLP